MIRHSDNDSELYFATAVQISAWNKPPEKVYSIVRSTDGNLGDPVICNGEGNQLHDMVDQTIKGETTMYPDYICLPDLQLRIHANTLGYKTIGEFRADIENYAVAQLVDAGMATVE